MRSLLLAALAAIACHTDGIMTPPVGLPYAAANRTCAPNDGPAIAITIASQPIASLNPARPYVRVAVWKSVNSVVGTWTVPDLGYAVRYTTPAENEEVLTSGTVVVTAVEPDSTVTGTVDLVFPTGRVSGGFRAHWIQNTELCG